MRLTRYGRHLFDAVPESRALPPASPSRHVVELVYQMLDCFHNIFRSLEMMAKPTSPPSTARLAAWSGGGCDIVVAATHA
ncbi:MAG: hypothetical protein WKF30_10930 [Pyrinomonadaceae bacterium]